MLIIDHYVKSLFSFADDLVTPTIVCGSLFVAVGLNFWLKLGPKMVEGQD